MSAFDVFMAIVAIGALLFSAWQYYRGKGKETVDVERLKSLSRRLLDVRKMVDAVAKQVSLLGTISDRDETTKKELKHLAISALATIDAVQNSMNDVVANREYWPTDLPDAYFRLMHGSATEAAADRGLLGSSAEAPRQEGSRT